MKDNPTVIRSKKALTQAFFELLAERPQKRIPVKQLCERADYTRTTFYAHYEVIEDIPYQHYAEQWLAEFSDHYDTQIDPIEDPDQAAVHVTEWVFSYWREQVDVVNSLKAIDMEFVIVQLFQDCANLAWEKMSNWNGSALSPKLKEIITNQTANLMFMIFDLWVEEGFSREAREMAEIFLSLTPTSSMEKLSVYFG